MTATVRGVALGLLLVALLVTGASLAFGDVPGRSAPRGATPNPGTQEQELANITLPAPYNTFEFAVTCMACHAGTVDQQVAHAGNWAGTNMASAARDPFFRANEIGVNERVKAATGEDGAGNVCFRCHSPNGWYSGRFNPALAGAGDGSLMEHSILLSTDDEGVLCEYCHRSIGNVTYKRGDLNDLDPVWNMLNGVSDWPHAGEAYPNIFAGDPLGDGTMQLADGMSYGGRYGGSSQMSFSDLPLKVDPVSGEPTLAPGGSYTGQTYGVYPTGWFDLLGNDVSGKAVVAPDGSLPIHFEAPVGPPLKGGTGPGYDYAAQALSIEHPTFQNTFVTTSEFCGTCHNLTVPIANSGMPEQRTYAEWKYSDYGPAGRSHVECQGCHMTMLKHEYADNAPVTVNADPMIAGWFPYAKDRNPNGGTPTHKFAGGNRVLPQAMKLLYPEVDLEIIGATTGRDTRVFPGMMSDRGFSWDRATRNTELSLKDAADLQITEGPVATGNPGEYRVKVKVTNKTGHSLPTGYPDGRRLWISLQVRDGAGSLLYESGHYDNASAELVTDGAARTLTTAQVPSIDASSNAVMVYERRTGSQDPDTGVYSLSEDLLNGLIMFDNRIPPSGYSKAAYRAGGIMFMTYDEVTLEPTETAGRYPDGQGWDEVTYTFRAPAGAAGLRATAQLEWQTHSRDFVEHLKTQDTSTLRPQAPPSRFALNYPLTPTYLSDTIGLAGFRDLTGAPLKDNWGGIAYAAWLATGKGAPFRVAEADTGVGSLPPVPTGLAANDWIDPATTLKDPFSIMLTWNPVPGATGYVVYTRYGLSDSTASWDRLAFVPASSAPFFHNEGLNVAKSYSYRVAAVNQAGEGRPSSVVIKRTPWDLPLPPMNLAAVPPVQPRSVTLTWFDQADNEAGFIIERQDVPATRVWTQVGRVPSNNIPGFGGHTWFTDTTVQPNRTYNYRVRAYNASGPSGFSPPVAVTTPIEYVVTIRPSRTVTRVGRLLSLSGTVQPMPPGGGPVAIFLKKPGTARWLYAATRGINTRTGLWAYGYVPKVRGTFQFYAQYGLFPSAIVSVRVR